MSDATYAAPVVVAHADLDHVATCAGVTFTACSNPASAPSRVRLLAAWNPLPNRLSSTHAMSCGTPARHPKWASAIIIPGRAFLASRVWIGKPEPGIGRAPPTARTPNATAGDGNRYRSPRRRRSPFQRMSRYRQRPMAWRVDDGQARRRPLVVSRSAARCER